MFHTWTYQASVILNDSTLKKRGVYCACRGIMAFRDTAVIFAIQACSVFLTQLASTGKKIFDAFLAQSTLLHVGSIVLTFIYSTIIYFSYGWLSNRYSPRTACTMILSVMSAAILVLSAFILPYWHHTPQSLFVLAEKATS